MGQGRPGQGGIQSFLNGMSVFLSYFSPTLGEEELVSHLEHSDGRFEQSTFQKLGASFQKETR